MRNPQAQNRDHAQARRKQGIEGWIEAHSAGILQEAPGGWPISPSFLFCRTCAGSRSASLFFRGQEASIALLREAICTLEDEIAAVQPGGEAPKKSKAAEKAGEAAQSGVPKESKAPEEKAGEVLQVQPKRRGGIDLKAAWRRVRRWWGGRN